MRSVVVTGVSSGIGEATARVLAAQDFRVFGSVRKDTDAERLTAEIGAAFVPLRFDVTDDAAVWAAAAQVADQLAGGTLMGLVNNAGIARAGPLIFLDAGDFRHQIEVNLTAQLVVTQAFAPLLGADPSRQGEPGRIVMMSSVGGRNANPFLGPYSASKFAVEGLSESLRRELMVYGIDVIVVAPGPIATPIWDKAERLDISRYETTPYFEALKKAARMMIGIGHKGLPAERVGRVVLEALTTPHPKTRYAVGSGIEQLLPLIPKRLMDRMIARELGLTRKT
jgi:NAD(P)-dependent dehydrogenase (short-subunit alcohol dehydrogenase family)